MCERRFANYHLAADERGSSLEKSVAIGTHLKIHRERGLFAVAEPCTLGLLFLPREKIGEHQLLRVALQGYYHRGAARGPGEFVRERLENRLEPQRKGLTCLSPFSDV